MMRRKKVDPNAPVVRKEGSLPLQPDGFAAAKVALQEQLPGVFIGTGYGGPYRQPPCWRLYAYTDDPGVVVPSQCNDIPVERRALPPALGGHQPATETIKSPARSRQK